MLAELVIFVFAFFFSSPPSWFSWQNGSNRRPRRGSEQNRASTACAAEQQNGEALSATASKCSALLYKCFSIFLFLCSLALATVDVVWVANAAEKALTKLTNIFFVQLGAQKVVTQQ